jgi:oxygen-dependent protoporphyrinogen oxidase
MKRLVIVGGGISGLAAARGAAEEATSVREGIEIVLLERESVVGGKAQTLHDGSWLVEAGPTGYLDAEPAMDRLLSDAGLEQAKLPANKAAARRFIVRGGRMREVSAHPLRFPASGLLGPWGLLRILAEPFIPKRHTGLPDKDESIWDFAARRIGRQAADRLIAPMVLGVFAGDARKLSLAAAFPRLAAIEREYGSLVHGMLARRKERRPGEGAKRESPSGPAGWLTSFSEGLQSLPLALAGSGGFIVRTSVEARKVAPRPGGWEISTSDGAPPISADAVILSGEPWAMAPLVRDHVPKLARELDTIYCPPVTVVALGYGPEALAKVPQGFGVLIPRGEGYRILGCLWDSHIFPGRSPEGSLLLRVMLGGTVDPEAALLSDDRLMPLVGHDLSRLFGIEEKPVYHRIVRWERAIPQYELGHLGRVDAIERELKNRSGLFMAGNALYGISFGKAAATGFARGQEAARWLIG